MDLAAKAVQADGAPIDVAIQALASAHDVARAEGQAAVKLLDASAPANVDTAKGGSIDIQV